MSRVREWFLCFCVLSIVAGCGGAQSPSGIDDSGGDTPDQPDNPDVPDEPQDQGDPNSPYECERVPYPCTWSAVDAAVANASAALGHQVFDMLDAGQTVAQALAFLEAREDVADAIGSDVAVRFRLNSGRPIWVLGPGAIPAHQAVPPTHTAPATPPAQDVVGDEPKSKSALILSPYKWDFGDTDEGAELATYLNGVRGYEGHVQYLENTEELGEGVTYEDFLGWEAYDVVHVSSHGTQICPEGEDADCFTVVLAGDRAQELVLSSPEPGVDAVIDGTTPQSTETVTIPIGLTSDFFQRHYPSGLSNTIVYFSACQTALGDDLETTMGGDGTAVLGWTESVFSDTAHEAALTFFKNLGDKGVQATSAYEQLGALTIDHVESGNGLAVLSIYPGDANSPRMREIAYPRNPLNHQDLPNDTPYPIIGEFNDGNPDRIPYMIKVDGVEDDPSGFVVHVAINGFSAEPKPLQEGQAIDGEGNVWQVEGDVPVTFDAQYGQEIEVKVQVDLPEGGESKWDEKARLGEFALKLKSKIVVEGGSPLVRVESDVESKVDLAEAQEGGGFPFESILTYKDFQIEVTPLCSATAVTFPGTLQVLGGDLRVENGRAAVPDNLVIFIPPTIRETVFLTCEGGTLQLPFYEFFAGFYSFHGGELCGAQNEVDEDAGGLVITGWSAGSGEVAARKVYDRSCTDDDVTFTENTTLELIFPPPPEGS